MQLERFIDRHEIERLSALQVEQKSNTSVELKQFSSLADVVQNLDDQVTVEVVVSPNSCDGSSVIDLCIQGVVVILCQRCMLPMDFVLASQSRWRLLHRLVPPESENQRSTSYASSNENDEETISLMEYFGIIDLIGQEIIVSLPMVPKHKQEECVFNDIMLDSYAEPLEQKQPYNPAFDVLKTLKEK